MPATEFPGDIDARITALIEALYKDYYNMVSYAHSIVHNEQAAEDIVQDCFRKVWTETPGKKLQFLAMQSNEMKAYFYKMIRNACIDWLRKPEKIVFDTDLVTTKLGSLSDDDRNRLEITEEVIEHFHKRFETLSEIDKKVCVHRFLFELEVKEIAERLGLSYDQVSYKIRVLRNWFKKFKK